MVSQRPLRLVTLTALAALAAGCASLAPESAPSPQPRGDAGAPGRAALPPPAPEAEQAPPGRAEPPPGRGGPAAPAASAQLLQQARTERAAGRYAAAASAVERALRLAPNDPELWLELGEIHLADGNRRQAEMMARKALTLAAGDGAVESRAQRLIRAAAASR
ncbi:MAG TPA: tetratricopeptide repeat protein [Gammaproteobacteria bacterium]